MCLRLCNCVFLSQLPSDYHKKVNLIIYTFLKKEMSIPVRLLLMLMLTMN